MAKSWNRVMIYISAADIWTCYPNFGSDDYRGSPRRNANVRHLLYREAADSEGTKSVESDPPQKLSPKRRNDGSYESELLAQPCILEMPMRSLFLGSPAAHTGVEDRHQSLRPTACRGRKFKDFFVDKNAKAQEKGFQSHCTTQEQFFNTVV